MDLAEVHRELVAELRYGMSHVGGGDPIVELGDLYDELSAWFEALGLCHFLELADTGELRKNLVRSGQSRRHFLRRSRLEGNVADRHLALTRNRAFLDAAAAGDVALARDIAVLSGETWNPSWEYEDDFCFRLLLHRLAADPARATGEEGRRLVDRLERALEGATSPFLDVGKALIEPDVEAFTAALEALLEDERGRIERDRSSPAVHEGELTYWPRSQVSIDGLALLNLAELVGIRVQKALPLCHELARFPWTTSTTSDLFEMFEQAGG